MGGSRAANGLLEAFVAAGVLTEADVRWACRLGRMVAEDDPAVLLGAALAVRAPRYGHVCVELDQIAERVAVEPRRAAGDAADRPAVADLAWPGVGSWAGSLVASPLVHTVAATVPPGVLPVAGAPPDPGALPDTGAPLVLDAGRLYLDRYWRYERRLADDLQRRAVTPGVVLGVEDHQLSAWLDMLFGPSPEPDRQRLAAVLALTRPFTAIAGGPGTGKTYTVARVLALLHTAHLHAPGVSRNLRVALAAPTGKAAARLQESLREGLTSLPLPPAVREAMERTPAMTIHRLLGVQRGTATRFRHDREQPLVEDVVIVDEASMVSLPLMAKLVDAVRPDARLILLGDRDQLASVEAGAVFGDLCGPDGSRPVLRLSAATVAAVAPVMRGDLTATVATAPRPGVWDAIVRLDRFRRFGERSELAMVAGAIQRLDGDVDAVLDLMSPAPVAGAGPAVVTGAETGVSAVSGPGGAAAGVALRDPDVAPGARHGVEAEVVDAYAAVMAAAWAKAPPEEVLAGLAAVRVLCAHRRGPEGVQAWNQTIEARLAHRIEGFDPTTRWYVGRPVMITENDHAARLYNGDVGIVLPEPGAPHRSVVAFWSPDGSIRTLTPARVPACETTFAMTIHKSQGSQFTHAVVVLPAEPSPLLTRELVYTAVTRATHRATVLGRREVLRQALLRPIQRASGLQSRLWGVAGARDAPTLGSVPGDAPGPRR